MIVFCTTHSEIGGVARVQQHIREILHANRMRFTEIVYEPHALRFLNKIRFIRELKELSQNASMILFSHLHLFRAMDYLPSYDVTTVVFTHGLELYKAGPEQTGALLKKATRVITNSKFNENWLVKKAGLHNVTSVYYPGLRFTIQSSATSHTVLCVSRMMKTESYKGHEKLIYAWKKVQKEIPDSKLIFCGTGDLMGDLKKLAKQLHILSSIEFSGHVSDLDLIDYYQDAALFAMPSTGEGQGLVWQEAMQAGLPVIAVQDTVAEEFVTQKENGFLVPYDYSADDLSEAIINGLKDHTWRAEVQKENQKKIRDLNIQSEFHRVMSNLFQNRR